MRSAQDFFNLYYHDLIRTAVAVPAVRVADPAYNSRQDLFRQAVLLAAQLALIPDAE